MRVACPGAVLLVLRHVRHFVVGLQDVEEAHGQADAHAFQQVREQDGHDGDDERQKLRPTHLTNCVL